MNIIDDLMVRWSLEPIYLQTETPDKLWSWAKPRWTQVDLRGTQVDRDGPSLPKTLASRTDAANGGNEADLRLRRWLQQADRVLGRRRAAVSAHHAGSPRRLWSLGGGASFPPTRPHLPSPPQTCPTGRTRQAFVQSGKTKASINSSDQVGRPRGSCDAQVIDFLNYPGVPLRSEASWKETWQFQTFKTRKINNYIYNVASHSWEERRSITAGGVFNVASQFSTAAGRGHPASIIHPSNHPCAGVSRNQDTLPGLAAASHEQAPRNVGERHLEAIWAPGAASFRYVLLKVDDFVQVLFSPLQQMKSKRHLTALRREPGWLGTSTT